MELIDKQALVKGIEDIEALYGEVGEIIDEKNNSLPGFTMGEWIALKHVKFLIEKQPIVIPGKMEYTPVVCVTSGDGYIEGCVYPMMGWNNGMHILRQTEGGDVKEGVFCTGGVGRGLFNSWGDSGCPSFNPVFGFSEGEDDDGGEE